MLAAFALLAFLVLPQGMKGQTIVASYSRSGNSNTITGGTFTTTFSAKSGYYQDANGDCYMQILNANSYWTSVPTTISFVATIGGGTGDHELTNPVYVSLLDEDGEVINATQTEVTSYITASTGDSYTISIPVVNNVYGVKLSHEKETGYNVRYYSFSLSFTGDGPTTFTVTYDCNGGTSGCPENVTGIEAGGKITLANAPTKDGFDFDGWNDGNNTYDAGDEYTVNGNVTFTAQWTEVVSGDVHWALTDLANLTSSDVFVMVGNNSYAMTNDNGASTAPATVDVTIENNEITSTVAANIQWTVSGNATNGYSFYPNGSTSTWLYCSTTSGSGNNNNIRVGTGDRKVFELNTNNYLITNDTYADRYLSIYNNADWRGYLNTSNGVATMSFYKKVTGSVVPPSITANNVSIAYDATSGEIAYTLNNPATNGSLSVSDNVDWISNAVLNTSENKVTFTTTANEATTPREGIITITYTYGDNETVSKDVTVTQAAAPIIYTTIPDLFAAATGTETNVLVTFNNWVVSGVSTNGKNVFVTDNNGNGFVIFDRDGGLGQVYSAGNILSGTAVSCRLLKYNGFAELLNVTATDLTITSGGTVAVADVAMANLAGVNTGALLHYDNLTCVVTTNTAGTTTYYNLTDGTTTIQVYNAIYAFEALVDGKTYNITGVYQQFNNTKEILPRSAADIVEVVTTNPSIAAENVNIACDATSGAIEFTVNNPVTGGVLTAATTAGWLTLGEVGTTVPFTCEANTQTTARTATVTLTYTYNRTTVTKDVTVTQAAYVIDYATLPFEFDGGKGDIASTNGLTHSGLGDDYNNSPKLRFDGAGDWLILHFNEAPGILTFNIKGNSFSGGTFKVQVSVDGETYTDLATYTELGATQTETFNALGENVRYIKWIYAEKDNGNVALGKIKLLKYTEPVPSITVSPATVNAPATGKTDVLAVTYENITEVNAGVYFCDAEGEAATYDWIHAEINANNSVDYSVDANAGEARTAYLKVYVNDVYSNLVTITQNAYMPPYEGGTYTLTTVIESGKTYIIVGNKEIDGETHYFAMGEQRSNNRGGVEITVNGTKATVTSDDIYEFVITELDDPEGYYYSLYDARTPGYLYAAGSDKNYLKTEEELDENGNGDWAIGVEDGVFSIIASKSNNRNVMQFNYSVSNGTPNPLFSCYASANQLPVSLYVKDEPGTLVINGYGNSTNGGYYLITTPVQVNPQEVEGMTGDEFDLYYFDQTQEKEWLNYKDEEHGNYHFNLDPGRGYLYARKTDVILHFSGSYQGDGVVNLVRDWEGAEFEGLNLVGNPFFVAATIDRDYYVLNDNADGVLDVMVSAENEIAPLMGVFVVATMDGEEMAFVPVTGDKNLRESKLVVNVSAQNSGVIDRAIVNFNDGSSLPKFNLNPRSTKLFIPQGNNDYAAVRSEAQGETPLSFKAAKNGTYTLSVNTQNVEMDYLHLIDNMTGADVDLLANPNYTFDARYTDRTSRFKLVFKADVGAGEAAGESFAFVSDGHIILTTDARGASLQVVDMLGHVIQSYNGDAMNRVSTVGMAPGVYVLRLVNGNDIKTQKIVIE